MTQSHRWFSVLATIAIVSILCSCVSSRPQQQFAMSFLPAPLPAPPSADEPTLPSGLYEHSMPNLAQKTLSDIDWPGEVDSRILRAQQQFESGKKFYQRGDIAAARQQFDLAIDTLLTAPERGTEVGVPKLPLPLPSRTQRFAGLWESTNTRSRFPSPFTSQTAPPSRKFGEMVMGAELGAEKTPPPSGTHSSKVDGDVL